MNLIDLFIDAPLVRDISSMKMPNQTKVVPYSFTPSSKDNTDDDYDRRRRDIAWAPSTCCTCYSSFCGGLILLILLIMAIAIPLLITIAASTTSTTTIITTTSTTSTSTVTTTAITCSPACSSEQTCVLGDGDIVVSTPNGNTINYMNMGPSTSTDQGQLDADCTNGTGPENVFWSRGGPIPPTGTYYVCFEPYFFNPNITSADPISVTIDIKRSNNTNLSATQNYTSTIRNNYACDANSMTLLISFTYP
ncbi:unnamed protein product [Adineta steineri]|uniref:Uncharacterized protein n=1 Tax=Adineta steineri TaxID=433720 RepID=A0A814FHL0_9BILA|nr:unnamed protein product [Adineta steineri]CAF0982949.1 unnamed protein product [Adineta steineri]